MGSEALVSLVKPCGCPGRRLPIRLDVYIAALIARSTFAGGAVALTYRCLKCRTIVEVTVADVRECWRGAAS